MKRTSLSYASAAAAAADDELVGGEMEQWRLHVEARVGKLVIRLSGVSSFLCSSSSLSHCQSFPVTDDTNRK